MELSDALMVAFSGYMVVFFGLTLTSLIIFTFSVIPKIVEKLKSKKNKKVVDATETIQVEDIDPDILAVITSVLEIERRLHFSYKASKLTFSNKQRSTGLY